VMEETNSFSNTGQTAQTCNCDCICTGSLLQ
jgi:hypothetical protein